MMLLATCWAGCGCLMLLQPEVIEVVTHKVLDVGL